MENLNESGKIYFFKTNTSEKPAEAFGPLLEVNSNFDILKSLNICGNKALGITSNNELLEWEFDSKQTQSPGKVTNPLSSGNLPKVKSSKKKDFYFLLFKPSYHFHKIKFLQVTLNKTMCIGLDIYHNVLVWGQSKEGLLGLGYEITSVDTPTLIPKLKEIKEVSLSEYHAVALNNNGNAFSWGLGKYGELGLERSIYTPTPQPILTETMYSKVFCGNLITCFLDDNGKFYYFGVIIKQLGGYGNIVTIKSLLNDQSFQDGKNIYFEKEIEELENESFKNIVIGNGFVALLSKNGLLYVVEYNNKLTMLYNKYFLYNITVAYNEIYGLARERPKVDKKRKDKYYLFKWSSKYSSENDLYSDIWSTTIWKFKEEFQLISNCKLLETNNNKSILLLKDQDEKYNLTNSIFNPHRKNLEMSAQNNEMKLLEKSVNNPNISAFGDLVINKKILPEKFLEFNNQYDDSYNIKYKKCKLKLNIRTGIDNSSLYLNNNKSRTFNQLLKNSQINNNQNNNNKNNSSSSPFIEQNFSHNNNLFSESYNAQFDLGKENDNVNIYKPEEEDDILDAKEKELNKYRNEVDNIINNFKSKKDSNNLTYNDINYNKKNPFIYTSRDNNKKNKTSENNLKYISQNNSNQNERYSSSGNNFYGINNDEENNIGRIKLKLSKEEMINLIKLDNKRKEKENMSNYNDSLSRVRNNIISVKDKIKFKDNTLNKINNLFNLSEEEKEDDELDDENNDKNSEDDNNVQNKGNKKINNNNKMRNIKKKQMLRKFMRSPSFSILKSKTNHNKGEKNNLNNEENEINKTDSDDFVNIEEVESKYKRKRYNSKDNILLKEKDDDYNQYENENLDNLGLKYISGNNSMNDNFKINKSKKKNINIKSEKKNLMQEDNESKNKNKLKEKKKQKKNNEYTNNEEEEEEEEEEGEENEEENYIGKAKKNRKIKSNSDDIKEENIELINDEKDRNNINKNNNKEKRNKNNIIINKKNKNFQNQDINYELDEHEENKFNKNSNLKKDKNRKINNKSNQIKGERNEEEEEFEENEDEEGFEFFDEINENNNKIRKIKKIRGNKKIRIKKSNSISNEDFDKIYKPKEYKIFEDSLKEADIKSKNKNKKSYSLDKIDERKSISNILGNNNRLYQRKKKNKRNIINNEKIGEEENYEEEEEHSDNENQNINSNNKSKKIKNKKKSLNKNKKDKDKDDISNKNDDEKNEYNENNEITFKKKMKKDKNKIIDNKRQFNTGKTNIIKNKNKQNENSKNSFKDDEYENNYNNIDEYENESNNENNINKKSRKENIHKHNQIKENKNFENNFNNIKYFQMHSYGIKINKFSLMYFCDLIDHYMKKKSFSLCARQIANYQKYLEIKFSLKILFRVMLKRIIFYKLKFMHRYKRINKYLIKNKIKNIKYAYKKKK